ncbi:MAG: DNA-directed RNA polymerase subunit beta [Acidobacteriota bacterium]
MPNTIDIGTRERREFSRINSTIPIPNLLEIQRESYRRFLQMELLPEEREIVGLQEAFSSVFPIQDFRGECSLQFVDYTLGDWECRCGFLKGLEHLRQTCSHCKGRIIVTNTHAHEVQCQHCGQFSPLQVPRCPHCDDNVSLRVHSSVSECQERGMTFGVPLKIRVRLEVYQKDASGTPSVLDIKEEEVFFGNMPLMTEKGTFIINGTERAVVSQLHRSPGVFFQANENRTEYVAKIIPARGSWVELELDSKEILHVRIDRKRRFPATVFLRALGLGDAPTLLKRFYPVDKFFLEDGVIRMAVSDRMKGLVSAETVKKGGETLVEENRKIRRSQIQKLQKAGVKSVKLDTGELADVFGYQDVADQETGEILAEAGQPVQVERFFELARAGVKEIEVILPKQTDIGTALLETVSRDVCKTQEEAYLDFFRKVRPGDPVTPEGAKNFFNLMFFDGKRYDFSQVGALKLLTKLHWEAYRDLKEDSKKLEEELERRRVLTLEDYCELVEYLLKLKQNIGTLDDIDHLGNRRVRCVGELLENQIRIGLARMERATKEKMSVYHNLSTAMPRDLLNAKPVVASILEFFGSSQLSQFMDQTNPLSEITHKRRLSALGPGGLSRERAGFEVRDVHTSHYGRLCPIETPEGPNIGLISSLSTYARINKYGFIESPYKKVEDGRVLNHYKITFPGEGKFKMGQVVLEEDLQAEQERCKKAKKKAPQGVAYAFYLTAWEEDLYIIAQANVELDKKGRMVHDKVQARKTGEFILANREDVQFIDVSPKQLVSIAAALIPFLEHDDANRALMGSNMQRQAVPLLRPEAPVVGTGMELVVGKDSESTLVCRRDGIVDAVDANRIIVRVSGGEGQESYDFGADIYTLTKSQRSNQNTCINQKPIVNAGQKVKAGDVLADGPCTDGGELALGRNVLVAFMPWNGYNYEDAILLSEKLVKEDVYTSIHIEELEIQARDTKLGKEEVTRDIPNISESYLKDLDDSGIIRIGAHVNPGDILVGKVTPKGETQMTPEEKLLRAIFGEKSAEYRDASLRCPPGISGVVVDVKIFTRKGEEKDARTRSIEEEYIAGLQKNLKDQIRILREENRKKIQDLLEGTTSSAPLYDDLTGKELVGKGVKLTAKMLSKLRADMLPKIHIQAKFKEAIERIQEIEERTRRRIELLEQEFQEKIANLERGDELLPGVIKMVKVYVAIKRKIQVGDKMAGRHGNKGVVSRILPEEDMPFMPDGTPVQIVLNPLGVPSRMNVGQILETHLGWAARALGFWVASPVFDGATEGDIKSLLGSANLPEDGKIHLRDGRSGTPMHQRVTVGQIYMLKLAHLVEDKIHARSIGPYSLITQQPLGGKAQFGGQRFGEMEVWALEAYGAANILQEILTVKSDDVYGRTKMYESIVKGQYPEDPGVPESFNVLVKELQGLGIDVQLIEAEAAAEAAEETSSTNA